MSQERDQLVVLYKEMAELTLPECKNSCRVPLSCCSPEYCDMAQMGAADEAGSEACRFISGIPSPSRSGMKP